MNQKEFNFEKKLSELKAKNDKEKHKFHMKELEFQKDLENLKFDNAKQLQRIRSAEVKRTIDRRKDFEFMKNYPKGADENERTS